MKNNFVIVLHPSDELKIISFQKCLYEKLQSGNSNGKIFRLFPLWFFFSDDDLNYPEFFNNFKTPKDFSEKITSVEISSLKKEDNFLYLIGKFILEFSESSSICLEGKMKILQGEIENIPLESISLFPRIFRSAFFHQDGKSYWLTDSSWRKLTKKD